MSKNIMQNQAAVIDMLNGLLEDARRERDQLRERTRILEIALGFISEHCDNLPRAKQVAVMTLSGIDVTNPLRNNPQDSSSKATLDDSKEKINE